MRCGKLISQLSTEEIFNKYFLGRWPRPINLFVCVVVVVNFFERLLTCLVPKRRRSDFSSVSSTSSNSHSLLRFLNFVKFPREMLINHVTFHYRTTDDDYVTLTVIVFAFLKCACKSVVVYR